MKRSKTIRIRGTAWGGPSPLVCAPLVAGTQARLLAEARKGLAGDLVDEIAPREGDRIVVKPRYSAFKASPLRLILEELGATRILLAGTATEMCVTQTAIDARDLGLKVTVIAEACSSVDAGNEELALAYLERVAGAWLQTVDEVLPASAAA